VRELRKRPKKIFCLLCAEEKGMLVGFPHRAERPWNRLKVPSRIDHLRFCHFVDADETNYDKYFACDEKEIVEYLERKFGKEKKE
jgi:hypothetical protein